MCSRATLDGLNQLQFQAMAEGFVSGSVTFSSDVSLIDSGSNDKSVRVWEASMGIPNVLEGHTFG
jgi:WD40 repeat protein